MARTAIAKELDRIQTANGGLLRASDVVKEATPEGSPLHPHFNWDNTEAAHQWRLQQARQLIRVTVNVLPYDEPHHLVRAYVSLSPDRNETGGGYRAMVQVLNSRTTREQMLADALDELTRLKVKYYQLSELSAIFAAIENAKRDYDDGPPPPPPGNGNGGGDQPAA